MIMKKIFQYSSTAQVITYQSFYKQLYVI